MTFLAPGWLFLGLTASLALVGLHLLAVYRREIGSEFGGRQLQFEMFHSAAQHVVDRHVFRTYDWSTGREHVRRLRDLD